MTTQKWINLYSIMLEDFKGRGHGLTIDSAYMGDIMALIGRYKWEVNIVGTAQENCTGADTAEEKKALEKGTYEAVMWQHALLPLCFAIWCDNNFVRTLSNFNSPKLIKDGLMRKRRFDGKRERKQSPVDCPEQNRDYSKTFHLIDKGNGAEAKYDLGMKS